MVGRCLVASLAWLALSASAFGECGSLAGVVKTWASVTKEGSLLGFSGYRPTGNTQSVDDPTAPWNVGPVWKWKVKTLSGETRLYEHPPSYGVYTSTSYSGYILIDDSGTTNEASFTGCDSVGGAPDCVTFPNEYYPEVRPSGIFRHVTEEACWAEVTGPGYRTEFELTAATTTACGVNPHTNWDETQGSTEERLSEPDRPEDAWERAGPPVKGHFRKAFLGVALTTPESTAPISLARRAVTVTLTGCGGPYKIVAPYRTGKYGGHTALTEAVYATNPEFEEKLVPDLENVTFDENGEYAFELPVEVNRVSELWADKIEMIPLEAKPLGSALSCTSSMRFVINLGAAGDGTTAGILRIKENELGDAAFTPAALQLAAFGAEVEEVRDSSGFLRQVKVAEGLFDIITLSGDSYKIDVRLASDVGSLDSGTGLFAVSGSPIVTYAVSEAPGSTLGDRRLILAELRGTKTTETIFRHAGSVWETIGGNGLRLERLTTTTDGGDRIETREYRQTDDTLAWKQSRRIRPFPFGDQDIELIEGQGADARTTSYIYYDNPATDGAAYGKLKREVSPSGRWTEWRYDTAGRREKRVSQFLDTAPGSADNLNRVTEWTYSTVPDLDGDDLDEALETEIDTVLGQETGRRHRLKLTAPGGAGHAAWREERQIVTTVAGASWDATTNLVTITRLGLVGRLKDRTLWQQAPDGLLSSLDLEPLSGGGRKWIARSGILHAGEILGRREEISEDVFGRETLREVYESGLLVEMALVATRDELGRPTETVFLDGSTEHRQYACCGLSQFRGRDGVLTTYEHDALGRVERESTGGIALVHTHDAAGRRTKTVRVGSDDSEITLFETTYDTSGRLVAETDAAGRLTAHVEQILGDGKTERRTLHPDGEEIRLYHPDGSLASVRGDAAAWRDHAYGVDSNGYFEQELFPRGDEGASPAAQWVKRYRDQAGRPVLVRHADGAEEHSAYDASGRLASRTDADGVRTLFASGREAGSAGRLEEWQVVVVDLASPGVIDYAASGAGADRISRTRTGIALRGSLPVLRSITERWMGDGDNPEEIARTETTPDGRQCWSTHRGQTTHLETQYDGLGGRIETSTLPDGTRLISTYTGGRLHSAESRDAADNVLRSDTYAYDPHGRLQSQTQVGVGTTSYTYFDDGQVETVTTPDPGTGAQTTSYSYNSRGWLATVTHPDSAETHTTYHPTGQVKRTWGARAYPVEYAYDAQGRMKTLTTWQDFAGETGAATTTWNYHSQRGWLENKRHHDNNGPSYTYTPAGRLHTRTWARTAGGSPLVTTYAYTDAGDLESITYSDTTPAVSHTYDRAGRLHTPTDAAGLLTRAYDPASARLAGEAYTGTGLLSGRAIARTHDTLHRPQSLATDGGHALAYTYDSAGRLDTVTQGFHLAKYAYAVNLGTVEGVTIKRLNVERVKHTRTTDALGRTTWVQSASNDGATIHVWRDYTYNAANQRTDVELEDTRRWAYGYNDLGQVTSAQKRLADDTTPLPGYTFGYAFDDIGNRTATTTNGRAASYTRDAGLLNQYMSRQVSGAFDVRGEADPLATVTVEGLSTTRTDRDFYREIAAANTGSAVNTTLAIVATLGDDTVTQNRPAFLPQTPEAFAHDDDGNLTQDGRWDYTWDAENRLIAMETRAVIAAAFPALKQRLEFAYDAQGRRIAKRVFDWDPSTSSFVLISKTKFLYDGWNLLTELDALNGNALVRSHVWGLDLSGSQQGAGGVGGLLWSSTPTHSFAASADANGNIVAWINTATLAVSGRADYGPFGERVQATGVAAALPFGFSTKYTDAETGLLYYGFRYNSPSLGRWLSRDPIEEGDGPNMYAMVRNNPVNLWDYLGLAYGRNLTKDEAEALACAINSWLVEATVANALFLWGNDDKSLTLRFLKRYMAKTGGLVNLSWSDIRNKGAASIKAANLQAPREVEQQGVWRLSIRTTGDLSTSVGRTILEYGRDANGFFGGFDDRYTFLDTRPDEGVDVTFPRLQVTGREVKCCWMGGNNISDEWMADLERFGFAKSFDVKSRWRVKPFSEEGY